MKKTLLKVIREITEDWDCISIFFCVLIFVVFPPAAIAFAIWLVVRIIQEMEDDND